jgi:hypothetical protein
MRRDLQMDLGTAEAAGQMLAFRAKPVDTYGNSMRHMELLDPDGNSLSLAEMPAQ